MGFPAVVLPFGAVADQLIYPVQRRNDTQEGRVCTACGRNNSPEWRKVSSISVFPLTTPFPDLSLAIVLLPDSAPPSAQGGAGPAATPAPER